MNRQGNRQLGNQNDYPEESTLQIRKKIAESLEVAPYCKDVRRYQRLMKVGHGTYGEVFKAKHRKTKKIVALKKMKFTDNKEGYPIWAIREIKILQSLNQENIVNLRRICMLKPCEENEYTPEYYLVFDFADHDLSGLLMNPNIRMDLSEKKAMLRQIFTGLFYLHDNNVLHRDLKSANILVTRKGVVKLADFGLARVYTPPNGDVKNNYTPTVATTWYRAPEILLGERNYGPAMDMWSAGCIMPELWTKCPILPGRDEYRQLQRIVYLCGSITPAVWPRVKELRLYQDMNSKIFLPDHFQPQIRKNLEKSIPDDLALDLIGRLLTLDPSKRFSAEDALMHDFFFEDPLPGDLSLFFKRHPESSFEFLTKKQTARPDVSQQAGNPRKSFANAPIRKPMTQREQTEFEEAF